MPGKGGRVEKWASRAYGTKRPPFPCMKFIVKLLIFVAVLAPVGSYAQIFPSTADTIGFLHPGTSSTTTILSSGEYWILALQYSSNSPDVRLFCNGEEFARPKAGGSSPMWLLHKYCNGVVEGKFTSGTASDEVLTITYTETEPSFGGGGGGAITDEQLEEIGRALGLAVGSLILILLIFLIFYVFRGV